jgi:hypothetical protein
VLQYFVAGQNVLVPFGRGQSTKVIKEAVQRIALADEL